MQHNSMWLYAPIRVGLTVGIAFLVWLVAAFRAEERRRKADAEWCARETAKADAESKARDEAMQAGIIWQIEEPTL